GKVGERVRVAEDVDRGTGRVGAVGDQRRGRGARRRIADGQERERGDGTGRDRSPPPHRRAPFLVRLTPSSARLLAKARSSTSPRYELSMNDASAESSAAVPPKLTSPLVRT